MMIICITEEYLFAPIYKSSGCVSNYEVFTYLKWVCRNVLVIYVIGDHKLTSTKK